jgi:hypothetical protein
MPLLCQVHTPPAQEEILLVPSQVMGTKRLPILTRQIRNLATGYVAGASTARQLRPRRGVALCSLPENWWVTELPFISEAIHLRHSFAAVQQMWTLRAHTRHSAPEEVPTKADPQLQDCPSSLCTIGHEDSRRGWLGTSSFQTHPHVIRTNHHAPSPRFGSHKW